MASIFLAKFFAIYFFVMGFLVIVRQQQVFSAVREMTSQKSSLFFIAVFTFILGITLVLLHHTFTADWRSIITVFAWLTLIKGIALLFYPDKMLSFSSFMISKPKMYTVIGVIMMILAIYLAYHGIWG